MATTWIFLIVVFLLIALTARLSSKQNRSETGAVLRHTILVNLQILEGELTELQAIATTAAATQSQKKATLLLQGAKAISNSARARLQFADNAELETILGNVFAAMNQSTEARHLLNACQPRR
jgi:hypothetical protein